ncbi:MAG: hypothetical protein QOG92_271 [Verrucomicrobiota bacterium]|jgi:hypothetical protein|nr:hypothetical protein [Verrucomicrobiota bacterium]MEA3204670.1 hypothetical protein [Verrucomicrobiota bacterium]
MVARNVLCMVFDFFGSITKRARKFGAPPLAAISLSEAFDDFILAPPLESRRSPCCLDEFGGALYGDGD